MPSFLAQYGGWFLVRSIFSTIIVIHSWDKDLMAHVEDIGELEGKKSLFEDILDLFQS